MHTTPTNQAHDAQSSGTPKAARRWPLNALILGFVGMQVALGIRTLALEDTRLGWGMFAYQTNYAVSYEWVLADGTTRKQPALGLAGRTIKYCGDQFIHRTRYGRGAIRCWMRSYLHYLCEQHLPADAVAARAVVSYRINKQGNWEELVVQVPEVTKS